MEKAQSHWFFRARRESYEDEWVGVTVMVMAMVTIHSSISSTTIWIIIKLTAQVSQCKWSRTHPLCAMWGLCCFKQVSTLKPIFLFWLQMFSDAFPLTFFKKFVHSRSLVYLYRRIWFPNFTTPKQLQLFFFIIITIIIIISWSSSSCSWTWSVWKQKLSFLNGLIPGVVIGGWSYKHSWKIANSPKEKVFSFRFEFSSWWPLVSL